VVEDALTFANIVGTLHAEKKQFSRQGVVATSYADLQKGADVLFAGFNNNWTIYLTRSMRYHFMSNTEGYNWIEDQKNPNLKIGLERLDGDTNEPQQIGLVARVFVGETNQPAIIMAGVGPAGTVTARVGYQSSIFERLPQNRTEKLADKEHGDSGKRERD
jgi:hypothetical protein